MSKVLKRLYLGDVVKSFGTKQLRKLTTEEPTNDPYGLIGTWVFNGSPNYKSFSYNVNFTNSRYGDYKMLKFTYDHDLSAQVICGVGTDGVTDNFYNYTKGRWIDTSYKTNTFTGGEDISNEDFATWLKASATKQ